MVIQPTNDEMNEYHEYVKECKMFHLTIKTLQAWLREKHPELDDGSPITDQPSHGC